ncbi:hypothetical protein FQN57_000112 [Myotisia sp. PD_48]|nr:hypothetical protein FQN57_000112 [Myotisia sp. PD_48]
MGASNRLHTLTPKMLPPRSWDSHMHIIEPDKYPLAPNAPYKPKAHTLAEAMNFESSVGIPNIVLVQPSIYALDNSCLLAALKQLGPDRARGVVSLDPKSIASHTLTEWHDIGVRGVRLNFQSVGKRPSKDELLATMKQYAAVIRPYDWVLQLYISLEFIPWLVDILPQLGVKVCFDHFGSPKLAVPVGGDNATDYSEFDPYTLPGFSGLIEALKQGNTYVKISAPYRLTPDPQFGKLREMAKEFIRVAHSKIVFATDWPHTRFDSVDIGPFIEACKDWCGGDQDLVEMLFQRNAEVLWGVEPAHS